MPKHLNSPLEYPFADYPEPGCSVVVAPGIRWLRMPLPFVLDHINLWLLDDGNETVLVDSGLHTDDVKTLWLKVIEAECKTAPPSRLLLTHCHPDHIGLARWLQERYEIPVYATQGEMLLAYAWWMQAPGYGPDAMLTFFRQHGLAGEAYDALAALGPTFRKRVPELPMTYRRLLDGDTVEVNGHRWQVIVGYGHSPEHASLYCAELNVLISGDMLLPRISTNISVLAATPDDNPLGRFLASLQRLGGLPPDTLVLPSHGKPFRGLKTRVDQLTLHHRARCDELLVACEEPKSAAELLPILFLRKLDAYQVMFAMGEAIAHLNYLEHECRVQRVEGPDGVRRYSRV